MVMFFHFIRCNIILCYYIYDFFGSYQPFLKHHFMSYDGILCYIRYTYNIDMHNIYTCTIYIYTLYIYIHIHYIYLSICSPPRPYISTRIHHEQPPHWPGVSLFEESLKRQQQISHSAGRPTRGPMDLAQLKSISTIKEIHGGNP